MKAINPKIELKKSGRTLKYRKSKDFLVKYIIQSLREIFKLPFGETTFENMVAMEMSSHVIKQKSYQHVT